MYEEPIIDYDAPDAEAHKWAMFCHLGGLATLSAVPFAGIIVPLILWQAKKAEHPFIDDQGKEALNFQICTAIYYLAAWTAVIILMFVLVGFLLIWVPPLIYLAQLGGAIFGGLKANAGKRFRYPFIFRLVE